MILVVALLDSMWDWNAMTSGAGYTSAPHYFRINPHNHSGKRLYRMVGRDVHLLVTNACRELVTGPYQHGKPDPAWVRENLTMLERMDMEVLLLCGNIAQQTYDRSGYVTKAHVMRIMHPASRTWTNKLMDRVAKCIDVLK